MRYKQYLTIVFRLLIYAPQYTQYEETYIRNGAKILFPGYSDGNFQKMGGD